MHVFNQVLVVVVVAGEDVVKLDRVDVMLVCVRTGVFRSMVLFQKRIKPFQRNHICDEY